MHDISPPSGRRCRAEGNRRRRLPQICPTFFYDVKPARPITSRARSQRGSASQQIRRRRRANKVREKCKLSAVICGQVFVSAIRGYKFPCRCPSIEAQVKELVSTRGNVVDIIALAYSLYTITANYRTHSDIQRVLRSTIER